MRFVTFAFCATLALSGCDALEPRLGGVNTSPSGPNLTPVEPDESPVPDLKTPEIIRDCRGPEEVGAQNTVRGQTNALRDGDFEAAYSYASPSFQDTVSLEQFTGLILASYQPLLAEAVIEFGECLARDDGGKVSLDVVLRAEEGAKSLGIRYVLVDTEEGWRVSGASDFRLAGQST